MRAPQGFIRASHTCIHTYMLLLVPYRYGSNEMPIPVKSIPQLIFDEMWHPFYVFQYFSIYVW